jgi:ATP-binding cassette, subfamily B, multidrug efflux pump
LFSNRLFHYFAVYKWRYLIGFIALIGASIVVMLPPVLIRDAIDAMEEGTTRSELAGFGLVILVLAFLESALRYVARQYVSGTSRYVEYELRNDVARKLMALDQSFYLRSQTGDLMARCTNDLQRVRDLAGPGVIEIGRAVAMMLIGFVFLLSINVRLALIALAYFPAVTLIMGYFRETVENKYRAVQDQFGELSNRVQENISGIRAIKAYAQEDSEIATFARANRELMRRTMSWAYYMGAFWPLMSVAGGASLVLVIWFGGRDVVAGTLTIGEFVQFLAYLVLLTNPLMSLGWTLTMIQQGIASMRRVSEVLVVEPRIADPPEPTRLSRIRGEVEFRRLTFGYQSAPVLRDVNLRVAAGETVALVGSTGAGKTTLANLLVRLHDPWEGQILLDGVDVRELSLEQLREAVGFVPQETFLFSESLVENIAYGRDDWQRSALDFAVATSQLVNDLEQLTHGIETTIGERGVTLSGGQKQRTALARALLKAPPVLVLDDALSHVDTHTEEEILRRLRDFMKERTTIIIAHRTSTLASADRIIVLDGGSIVETGKHADLIAKDGLYATFFRRQLLVEQMEEDLDVRRRNGERA